MTMPSQEMQSRFRRLRWLGFGLLGMAYVLVFFHRMAPGVVASELMASFQISGAALGSLAAMYYYVYTALQIPSGILADTLGPRYSVGISGLLMAAGSVVFGLADSYTIASVGRLMVGVGAAFAFVGLMKFNSLWFSDQHYGKVSGLTLLIGNLGAVSAAAPLAFVLGWLDWREVFVIMGGIAAGLSLFILIFLRNRPEDAGLPSVREMNGLPAHEASEHHWGRELLTVFRNPDIWAGFLVLFGISGAVFSFAGLWGVPLMQDVHGLDRSAAAAYTTTMLLVLAIGSLGGGLLSDALHRRRPVIICFALSGLAGWLGLALLPWQTGWSGHALYGLIGLSAGGIAVTYAAVKEVTRPLNAGMAIAVINTGLFLGAAIVQPLFGWVMDLTWDGTLADGVRRYVFSDYRNGLYLSAGFALIGVVGAWRVRETCCRNILVERSVQTDAGADALTPVP